MKLTTTGLTALLIVQSFFTFGCGAPNGKYFQSKSGGEDLTDKVLGALKRLVEFFERDYDSINLDGIYGLRIAEGQLETTLDNILQHPRVYGDDLRQIVENLLIHTSRAANLSQPYLEARNPEYYNLFKDSVIHAYKVPFIPRHVDNYAHIMGFVDKSYTRDPTVHKYNEKQGDECFGQMLPSSTKDGDSCELSDECLRMMTESGTRSYFATHQLLFTIEAQTSGCWETLQSALPSRNMYSFQRQLCDTIFMEATQSSKYSLVADVNQDLFLEQGVLCGMIGFVDFLREDWLRMILSWQTREGCYTNDNAQAIRREESILLRNLLVENYIEDGGCLSHKSGLAAGLLATYLRVLVENGGSLNLKV